MSEGEIRPNPEQVKPVTLHIPSERAQTALLDAVYNQLNTRTRIEVQGSATPEIREENSILRGIFTTLVDNLGRKISDEEQTLLGIIDTVPLEMLEKWAKPTARPGTLQTYAQYFIEQKRIQQKPTPGK